ncbi:MAG: hypothetical protein ACYSTS_19720 [Planctomycetota bacterium]|jgi:hypothetical protein
MDSTKPNIMKKPRIKTLNAFVKLYSDILMNDPPRVKWKQMPEHKGCADLKNNIIYLDSNNPVNSVFEHQFTYDLDLPEYVPSIKFRLKEGEQYFLTLLHEIGHFKMRYDLLSYLWGDWDQKHIAVEEWARKEFKKQRKRIKKILEGL